MTSPRLHRVVSVLLVLWFALLPLRGSGEDIDIFVGTSAGASGNPNVLIVLDNTSNWARQSQQWPGGEQQGQSEVDAIKTVIQTLDDKVNVGLLEFVTSGTANDTGGFVRYAIRPMTAANKATLSTTLDTIYGNVNSPDEKRNSGTEYGNLMADVYNYFSGSNQSQAGAGTLAALADAAGYDSQYGRFKSPLSCDTTCAKNFVIFIGNPSSSGPTRDLAANTTLLSAAGGVTSQIGLPNFSEATTYTLTSLGTSFGCYSSQSVCNTGLATSTNADYQSFSCGSYSGGCTCGVSVANSSVSCPTGNFAYTLRGLNLKLGQTSQAYLPKSSSDLTQGPATTGSSKYPSTSPVETAQCTSGTASFSNAVASGTTGNGANKKTLYKWDVTCTGTSTSLGSTSACYASSAACLAASTCPSTYSSCACDTPVSTIQSCVSGGTRFTATGRTAFTTNTPTGTYTTDTNPFNADEWARHLYQNGAAVSGCARQPVTTYTLDVFNAQPNATHTSLMLSMANVGGGKYFTARNKAAITLSLQEIFREILAINSTFASASLPISATNRSQNENQVFIGTFRPDPQTKPRWFGNLKQYQLITAGGDIRLGDANGNDAINYNTGFLSECAVSKWTSDSGSYWTPYAINPPFSQGQCSEATRFNDLPDGSRVEKGAVAEVLRKGNNPSGAATYAVNRTLYTVSGNNLTAFDAASSGLASGVVDWVRGRDTENEDLDTDTTETRASIHGDVIHSRPLPVNYCTTTNCANTVVYYGSNDGTLRAVDAATGQEKWALVAPDFFSKLDRLRTQSPLVAYPNMPSPVPTPTPTPRDYFFDGTIGLYQNADNTKVWIFPTMRRGGRMVYALDVTNPNSPVLKWQFGCSSTGTCTTGADQIGQTWSLPNVSRIFDSGTLRTTVVMGGGYDTCEDSDTATPSCGSTPRGNQVYVLDADNGSVIRAFTTLRSVVADVTFIDMNFDGRADYAYAADTGGNLYRIAFVAYAQSTNTYTPLAASAWTITRVAYTTGSGRKFHYGPALFGGKGKVFAALGSGDRERPLSTNYPFTTPVTNRFYVYRDCIPQGNIVASDITGGDSLDDTSKMNGFSSSATATCTATRTDATNCATNKGWFINLNIGTGEQTVTSAVIAAGMVTFSTNRPLPAASGTCTTPLGEANGYWLNLFTGSGAIGVADANCGGVAYSKFVGGGLPPSPVSGTVLVNGVPKNVVIGAVQRTGRANVAIDAQQSTPTNLPPRKKIYFRRKGDR